MNESQQQSDDLLARVTEAARVADAALHHASREREKAESVFAHDFRAFCRESLTVQTKQGELIAGDWGPAEVKLNAALDKQREQGRPGRVVVLKARQVYLSTGSAKRIFRETAFVDNQLALVVAHDDDSAKKIFEYYKRFQQYYKPFRHYIELPRLVTPKNLDSPNQSLLKWANGSSIEVETANNITGGRSFTARKLHLCLATGTLVLGGNGVIVPVERLRVGESVITHTGAETTVIGVTSRPNDQPTVIVRPWLGHAIELTANHPVWTQRGWVAAGGLNLSDRVAMPIRRITNEIQVSEPLSCGPRDSLGRERRGTGSGERLVYDRETGFMVGYYLAEGCILRQATTRAGPSAIMFGRDVGEKAYADRACAAVSSVTSSRFIRRLKGSRTVMDGIYGAPLARYLTKTFGAKDDKHVPDWVFNAGEEFCRGLLLGYLSGDGSKGYSQTEGNGDSPQVTATSIRASLATQARDLASSLGYGWGTITYKPGGVRCGRNEQAAWIVRWGGDAARRLRFDLGLGTDSPSKAPWVQRYEQDERTTWMRLRSLATGEAKEVWDVEVAHPDHSFRTLYFAVKNSEYSFYRNAPVLMTGLMQTLPDDIDTTLIIETTANGMGGPFYELWGRTLEGKNDFAAVFFAWWEQPEYSRPLAVAPDRFQESLSKEERTMMASYRLQLEQLNWRRWAIANKCEGDTDRFLQEYPSNAEESFIGSGRQRFRAVYIRQHRAVEPERGELRLAEVGMDTRLRFEPNETGALSLWDGPKQYKHYIIGADTAEGVDTNEGKGKPDADYSSADVVEMSARVQVAQVHERLTPAEFGRYLYYLGKWYNWAFVVLEVNSSGLGTLEKLLEMGYPSARLYRREVLDQAGKPMGSSIGWKTTAQNRETLVSAYDSGLMNAGDGGIILRSALSIREAYTFVTKPNGRTEAIGGCHDDTVVSGALVCRGMQQAMGLFAMEEAKESQQPFVTGPVKYGQVAGGQAARMASKMRRM